MFEEPFCGFNVIAPSECVLGNSCAICDELFYSCSIACFDSLVEIFNCDEFVMSHAHLGFLCCGALMGSGVLGDG